MSDRKVLTLIAGALILVGGILWALALTFTTRVDPRSQPPASLPPQSTSASPSPDTVSTPAKRLELAKRYLEGTATRESILTAQSELRLIPTSSDEYKEAQRLLARSEIDLKAAKERAKAEEIATLRNKLKDDYERLLSDSNPHLNFITTRLDKHKSGFSLWGVHTYFGRYTFSIGEDAKVVTAWLVQNRSNLRRAGIVRVGVRSEEDWGGSCWFNV